MPERGKTADAAPPTCRIGDSLQQNVFTAKQVAGHFEHRAGAGIRVIASSTWRLPPPTP
jgi:hypothetical protein